MHVNNVDVVCSQFHVEYLLLQPGVTRGIKTSLLPTLKLGRRSTTLKILSVTSKKFQEIADALKVLGI